MTTDATTSHDDVARPFDPQPLDDAPTWAPHKLVKPEIRVQIDNANSR